MSNSSHYAKSLFELGKELKQTKKIEEDLNLIQSIFEGEPQFIDFLIHPSIHQNKKKKIFNTVFQGYVTKETETFIFLLVEQKLLEQFHLIVEEYKKLLNTEQNVEYIQVSTASTLSDEEIYKISEKFSLLLNKKIDVQTIIDCSLIGGIVVQTSDKIFDYSIKNKLKHFTNAISEGGLL